MRLFRYLFFLAATLSACSGEQETALDRRAQSPKDVVARIGGRVVPGSELLCPPQTDVIRCTALRQEKFDRRARDLLIDAAARLHRITVPEEVVIRRMPKLKDDELRTADEAYKRYARAALRVRQGENKEVVYRQDLAPYGVRIEQFDTVLRKLPDVAAAQRALTLDVEEQTRRQFSDETRRRLLVEQLGRFVDGQCLRDGVSFDVAAERFWTSVIDKTESVVLDPTLQMPRMEGVLRP